jgi:hypothetical protein
MKYGTEGTLFLDKKIKNKIFPEKSVPSVPDSVSP